MKVLVIAEHDNHHLKNGSLRTMAAASQISQDVDLLVIGYQCHVVAQASAKVAGVKKVIHVDAACYAHPFAENLSLLVRELAKDYTHILAPASTFGKDVLPRVAALLDVAQISDVIQIIAPDTFVKPIYAGGAFATVRSKDTIKIMTIRITAFNPAVVTENNAPIEKHDLEIPCQSMEFVKQTLSKSERPDLSSARVVVSGGRGMQSGENFKLLESLADRLHAAIGASRAAVDAGFVPNDYQVGQTGKVVAPELYIAVGISGAIQHLAGMKESKVIVAINKDAEAPIFKIADFGLVGDLFQIIPELNTALDELKQKEGSY